MPLWAQPMGSRWPGERGNLPRNFSLAWHASATVLSHLDGSMIGSTDRSVGTTTSTRGTSFGERRYFREMIILFFAVALYPSCFMISRQEMKKAPTTTDARYKWRKLIIHRAIFAIYALSSVLLVLYTRFLLIVHLRARGFCEFLVRARLAEESENVM